VAEERTHVLEEWDADARPLAIVTLEGGFRRVTAIHDYPDKPTKGASRPLYLCCDDESDYVVKFPMPQWPRSQFNEVIGAGLLRQMDAPAPDAVIVTIPPELVAASTVLQQRHVVAGDYFGTIRMPNPLDLSDAISKKLRPSMIVNRTEVAGIIAFDNWVKNTDRNDGNALLVSSPGHNQPSFRLVAIDSGLILTGHAWTRESLQAAASDRSIAPCHSFLVGCVWGREEFIPYCQAVEHITESSIRDVTSWIPSAWSFPEPDREAVIGFLSARRSIIGEVLKAFPFTPDMEPPA